MSRSFNIKETVNKNIQNNQFPAFTNHRSMIGWCSMNYPKVLVNPVYLNKQQGVADQKKYQIDTLFQKKNPTQRQIIQFNKPFSNYQPKVQQKQGVNVNYQGSIKNSSLTLATVSHQQKAKIFQANNKIIQPYSAVLPMSTVLGPNYDKNFDRKVRQIGQVFYNPINEGQQMRHLKKLPNTVINQQNLMTILTPQLQHLDIQYKSDISNDLINKIGYLAPNIKSLNLTAVPIQNNVLIELGKSCKNLQRINISKCDKIQEFAVISFLKDSQNLKQFSANHMKEAITDACLQCFSKNQQLNILNINFCYDVTSTGIQFLQKKKFKKLGLSSLPNIKGQDIAKLLTASVNDLISLDISFNVQKDINNHLMGKVGMCTKIQQIILTGCQKISDQGINNLIYGQKNRGKQPQGFANLKTLKVGGLNVSDQLHQIVKRSPSISFLQANNLQRVTDNFLDQMKNYPGQRTVLLNFTPNVTDQKIKQIKQVCKTMKVIRNVTKMTDPADDGLRMPIPPASLKVKKPKAKKK